MKLDYLRISLTDRCDFDCVYCRPRERVKLLDHQQVLRFEEITQFVQLLLPWGLRRVRITGGEPLVRRDVVDLVGMINQIDSIKDVTLTTNGSRLARHASELKRAGLRRVNVSLDSLRPAVFKQITGLGNLETVLAGIEDALSVGLTPVKTNTVVLRGVNEADICRIVEFAQQRGIIPRFIEYMPFHSVGQGDWYVSNEQVRQRIEDAFGPLVETAVPGGGPATYLTSPHSSLVVGLISPISCPFCQSCSRLRLSADGQLKPCLISQTSFDIRPVLRSEDPEREMEGVMRQVIAYKKKRSTRLPQFERSRTLMFQVGG